MHQIELDESPRTTGVAPQPAGQPAFSRAAQAAQSTASGRGVLVFRLGGEEYGIDILRAQEIRGYQAPTHIAGAPEFFKGVVDLRGTIVPIIDLRVKFRFQQVRYDSFTVTIVLNIGERVIGIVVDSVSDVIELADDQVKPTPAFNSTIDADFITGIAPLAQDGQQRMLILIDIEKLMSGFTPLRQDRLDSQPSGGPLGHGEFIHTC